MKYLTSLLLLLLLGACSTKPYIVKTTDITVASAKEVYVVDHGLHTGFIVPADTITKQLPQLKERFDSAPFIEFGWGDEGFYQAEEITSGLTIQAIFWPTESVIHAVAVPGQPINYFPNSQVAVLCLQERQYSKLIGYIEKSFFRDNDGNIIPLKNGIYGNSQFYKGEGDYYLMNTCNKWTAKGLSSADMDISTTFKLTAGSIMDYLSEKNKALIG
jgi:uncharacterized protein (TIGR02117 family)